MRKRSRSGKVVIIRRNQQLAGATAVAEQKTNPMTGEKYNSPTMLCLWCGAKCERGTQTKVFGGSCTICGRYGLVSESLAKQVGLKFIPRDDKDVEEIGYKTRKKRPPTTKQTKRRKSGYRDLESNT